MEYKVLTSISAERLQEMINEAAAIGYRLISFHVEGKTLYAIMERWLKCASSS